VRFECRLILSTAAVYADQPDRFAALLDSLEQVPEGSSALLQQIHARRVAWREHLLGQPGMARMLLRQEESGEALSEHWPLVLLALSHLWEGQVGRVEPQLRKALQRAEAQLGRRSSLATMLAALQAAALWELDRAEPAAALLADRLDVLERSTLPQTVVLGFCTVARMASSAGAESRALELLAAMDAVGQARELPRLRVLSLTEQVRLHARHYRAETCRALLEEIDARLADPALPAREQAPVWWSWVDPPVQLARSLAALAAQDWRAAEPLLAAIAQQARARRLGRLHVESQALYAFVLDRCGEPAARALIREAMELADSLGLHQVFADAHPDLGNWVRELRAAGPHEQAARTPPQPRPVVEAASARSRATPSMVLTPKEREVLELLERNLTNKEIAMALQVGDETIKWHLKNLFAKLGASTRKQAVARARLLGLLVAEA
jgi:LuxR family maltose regulon positive regulatory protein